MRGAWLFVFGLVSAFFFHNQALAQTQVKPWFLLIFDTSGSMDQYTDSNDDGLPLNSCGMPARRINDAKCAVRNVVNATGDAVFGLAQFSQGTPSVGQAGCCPNGRPNEDAESYDICNSAYGTCGADFNSGRMRVGIADDNHSQILNLIDYSADATCSDELFPVGSTPLGGVLHMARRYFEGNVGGFATPTTTDAYVGCRPMAVILLTDGEETCGGAPVTRATELRTTTVPSPMGNRVVDIRTYVIGFGVSPGTGDIENTAIAGGTDAPGQYAGFYAQNQTELSLALSQIIADSQINEVCDGRDNDCDTRVDESWPLYCDPLNRRTAQQMNVPAGAHQGNTGTMVTSQFIPATNNRLCTSPGELCNGADDDCDNIVDENPSGVIPPEQCGNGVDNDCDGLIDEGCGGCTTEICDNLDNDCDMAIDEGLTRACGNNIGICMAGMQTCAAGNWGTCSGTNPTSETCNGLDDNCDGVTDGFSQQCGTTDVGACQYGTRVCAAGMFGNCIGAIGPATEICDGIDNDCDTRTDEGVAGLGVACGSDIGVCNPGATACQGGAVVCVGATGGGAETCDNEDDDCDGKTDEGNPGGGATCGTNTGACSTGNTLCVAGAYVCQGGVGPTSEVCNNQDDDCDTRTDEQVSGVGAACGTDVGECTAGMTACTGGVLVCSGGNNGGAETCDNQDDDCDGVVDEGNPGGGQACSTDVGECSAGTRLCVMGAYVCQGGVSPAAEICDNLDNDCDTRTDEGLTRACGATVGECVAGNERCTAGVWGMCTATTGGAETCDGRDNDCDGLTDEGNPGAGGQCGTTDEGECQFGMNACVGGSVMCVGAVEPGPELCDGLDNDCDGLIDTDDPDFNDPNIGDPCGIDEGVCEIGEIECVGNELVCNAIGPSDEICDMLDNDCDGIVDNLPDQSGDIGAPCGSSVGECQPGINLCDPAMGVVCSGGVGPSDEICDLLDNDCDGNTDEGLGLGEMCGTEEGECSPGQQQCVGGQAICVGGIPAQPERCDCLDNDCDGESDEATEGALCPGSSACVDCQCALPCVPGEFGFECATGKTPVTRDGQCYCVGRLCDDVACATETQESGGVETCAPDSDRVGTCVCRENACTSRCNGVVCENNTACDPRDGRCKAQTCANFPCQAGQVCDVATGECEEDLCATANCDDDQACRDGQCFGTCADVECDSGERCQAGSCVDDPCSGAACGAGQACDPTSGDCVADACETVTCGPGLVCDVTSGDCNPDPCLRTNCPTDQRCVAGTGECIDRDDPVAGTSGGGSGGSSGTGGAGGASGSGGSAGTAGGGAGDEGNQRFLAAGGGGCACTVTPGGPTQSTPAWWLVVAAIGLVAARRRVRRAGVASASLAIAVVATSTSMSGCSVDPFCLDCEEPGSAADGGAATSGSGGTSGTGGFGGSSGTGGTAGSAGTSGTGATDGGAATDAGPDAGCQAQEACNGQDDDCDGNTDEGIDTNTDENNCGGCGIPCNPAHAFGVCTAGECGIDRDQGDNGCDVGFHDLDDNEDNGCEYSCFVTAQDDTLCDLRDNNCNGEIDEDVQFDTDPMNCGSCLRPCRLPHATNGSACVGGACTLDPTMCDTGFHDADGRANNGCELRCDVRVDDTTGEPAPTEICNLRDDDCDGEIDEGVAPDGSTPGSDPLVGVTCGTDVGECMAGVTACTNGAVVCGGSVAVADEECDGVDNDCDGNTDERDPQQGQLCGATGGTCQRGTLQCNTTTHEMECVGGVGPAAELCDGLDNDCDRSIDEVDGQTGTAPEAGNPCGPVSDAGECAFGTTVCAGGVLQCSGAVGPATELCDGLNNDCDGATDEGNPGGGALCGNGTGECTQGTLRCVSGSLVCQGGTGASTETCDGRDNDCDGRFDEGNPGGGVACGSTTGQCRAGQTQCSGGAIVCVGATGPATEVCDGLNNDCDGATDEGNPGGGVACGTDVGQCNPGMLSCQSGALACMNQTGPSAEACDGLDNDCDGRFDEGNPGGGAQCGTTNVGLCEFGVRACIGGSLVCQGQVLPALEVCDNLDQDCDGSNTNGFSLQTDVRNCGTCGNQCSFQNGIAGCSNGGCTLLGCQSGYYNDPGIAGNDCLYQCNFTGAEICDGVDNDCDGSTDESLTAPSGFCTRPGVCNPPPTATCGGLAGWTCNYGGISTYQANETRCDNLDNDCDGTTDESHPTKGASCGVGTTGQCFDPGTFVCNSGSPTGPVVCRDENGQPPMAGVAGDEICDGVDNDCDGNTDEPCSDFANQNQSSCVEEGWAPLTGVANTYIMQYEASRTDATALTSGSRAGAACSKPSVMPWTNVTYDQARAACQAAGGDLCSEGHWYTACQNPSCTWSYSSACDTYAAQTCNGNDYGDTADAVLATGTLNGCSRPHGSLNVFDLSGNVKEWALARSYGVNPLRGGASNNTQVGISCGFDFPLASNTIVFPNIGFRCCRTAWTACQTIAATGVPVTGPDPGTFTSTIVVPALAGTIGDVNILGLTGTTDRFQDMRFSITSPSNTTVAIINSSRCGSDDNWSFSVDQSATNVVTNDNPFCNGSSLMGGGSTYRGAESLNAFNGQIPAGPWTLTIQDTNSSGGAPTLTGWSIQVCPQ